MIKIKTEILPRICQGDIYRDIEHIEHIREIKGEIEISKIVYPLVIVLTQECDLEQDYKFRTIEYEQKSQDKWLLSVLVAPMYNAEHVFNGEHLSELNMNMEKISKTRTPGSYLINNERPRYHYIVFPKELGIVPSVIDFKHYFGVDVKQLHSLKQTNYVCTIGELYRESITQRFSNFLSRIGLP